MATGSKLVTEHHLSLGNSGPSVKLTMLASELQTDLHFRGLRSFTGRWLINYSSQLQISSTLSSLTAWRGNGARYFAGLQLDAWVLDADIPDRLTELKDTGGVRIGWQYYEAASENTERYNALGILQSITTRAGVVQTLTYNASSQLTTVTDSYGRSLTFTYYPSNAALGANNIATVTDHLGNVASYAYDANNNLVTVTYPSGAPGSGLTATKTYHYNEPAFTQSTNLPNALTGITDENGIRYATYQYDSSGRAISTEHAGGVEKYQLNYVSPYAQTIVTDPLGTQRTYNFQTILGVVKTTGVSQPCPTCGGSNAQAMTYDGNGNVASRTDFNNKQSCYAYDLSRNLETARIEGLASGTDCASALAAAYPAASGALAAPDVKKITTVWHATYRLPTKITEPAASATLGGIAGTKVTDFTYDASGNLLTRKITAPKNDGSEFEFEFEFPPIKRTLL
jgi:YD repeat-containing protein